MSGLHIFLHIIVLLAALLSMFSTIVIASYLRKKDAKRKVQKVWLIL